MSTNKDQNKTSLEVKRKIEWILENVASNIHSSLIFWWLKWHQK